MNFKNNNTNSKWLKTHYLGVAAGVALAAASVASISSLNSNNGPVAEPTTAASKIRLSAPDNRVSHYVILGSQEEADRLREQILLDSAYWESTTCYYFYAITNEAEEQDFYAFFADADGPFRIQDLRFPPQPAIKDGLPVEQDAEAVADPVAVADQLRTPEQTNFRSIESTPSVSQVAAERAALTTLQEQVLVGVMSDGQRQTSDVDIMASVVSTERANFLNPESTQPLFANAADAEQAGNVAALESAFSVTLQGSFESIEDYAARERAALATLSNDTSARAADADIMASVISTERAAYGNPEPVRPMFGTAADAEYAAQSLR